MEIFAVLVLLKCLNWCPVRRKYLTYMEQILGVDVAASPTAVAHATLICETKHF